jgi:PPIC-type PPIASE domain
MTRFICFIILIFTTLHGFCQQKSMAEINTVMVTRTTHFNSLADSLAYTGVLKKVYGPFTIQGQKFLVQILARLPNTFYRISQIFIDTSVFRYRIADSLGKSILNKLKTHQDSFEHLAQTYSMGGEAATKGDLGWVAKGSILPAIDKQLARSKKGDVFMVWSSNGVHIIKLSDGPKQDNGVALMMRVIL